MNPAPLVPPHPAEIPFKVAFSSYLQFPLVPPAKLPTKYLTLGPTFYIFSVLSPRICFCFVNPYSLAGIAAFFEILLLAVSKHDLNLPEHVFRKNVCGIGFAGTVFNGSLQCRHKVTKS